MTDLDARLAVAVIGTNVVIDFGTHEAAMAGIERVQVLAAAAARPAGLDVERLARALAMTEVGCWASGARHDPSTDDEQHARDAADIAREYAALRGEDPR